MTGRSTTARPRATRPTSTASALFTVDDLAHVRWDSAGPCPCSTAATRPCLFSGGGELDEATDVRLAGNARVADMFQKAGVDLGSRPLLNVAEGKPATASFTTTSPALQATAPENAVDGATISGLPIQQGSYIARNPIWGTLGSPNAEDWLEVDLGIAQRVDVAKLYFYSNKNFGVGGNTYREPASYAVQYHDGSGWVDAARESRPAPNYNRVGFPAVEARRWRVLVTPTTGYGVGVKELQLFAPVAVRAAGRGGRRGAGDAVADGRRAREPRSLHSGRRARLRDDARRERHLDGGRGDLGRA